MSISPFSSYSCRIPFFCLKPKFDTNISQIDSTYFWISSEIEADLLAQIEFYDISFT
jgi:hypothetical protein